MVESISRGNKIYYDSENCCWKYSSTGLLVNNKNERCKNCGSHPTKEGHDSCFGKTLVGVMNACCGHGDVDKCYIQFLDGYCIRGEDARKILEILKKYN